MRPLPRCVLMLAFMSSCAAPSFAQQPATAPGAEMPAFSYVSTFTLPDAPPEGNGNTRPPAAPAAVGGNWLFRRFSIGTFSSTLGFGGRVATSITHSINLRAGVTYLSFTLDRKAYGVPYNTNVILQSEQVAVDWFPFHNFYVSPGWFFASSNRLFGSANVPPNTQLILNGSNYYSSTTDPVQATGFIRLSRSAPMITMGWGNWIRHALPGNHWAFPFEFGMGFEHDPKTGLDFTGQACTYPGRNCFDVTTNAEFQANVNVERKKLQDDADWARFYPILAGGIVYRF